MTTNIRNNALWAVAETLFSAATLFVTYRIVIHRLGIGSLGIWSLVVATTSFVRLVDPGASTGLSRFIALANARRQTEEVGRYFITALVSVGLFYTVLAAVAYWPLRAGLGLALSEPDLGLAQELLPYAIASFIFLNCYIAVVGALVGLQRADLRSKIVIVGLVVQLALVLALTPLYGLVGFAKAQNLQYIFGIVAGYLMTVRQIRGHFALWPRCGLKKATFIELWSFGLRLQSISVASFVYEPLSKVIISSIGGVETLGLYEMALKFVVQVRQLSLGPSAILMPAFTHLIHQSPGDVTIFYRRSLAAAVVIGASLMTAASASSPIVSRLVLGQVEPVFVVFVTILSAASFIIIVASPASNLAVAKALLGGNFWGAALASCGSAALAIPIGRSLGAIGVVSATVSALAAGSLLGMLMNARATHMPYWPRTSDLATFIERDLIQLVPFAAAIAKYRRRHDPAPVDQNGRS